VLRRLPHKVIKRSGTTSAIASSTAPMVHSLTMPAVLPLLLCGHSRFYAEEV